MCFPNGGAVLLNREGDGVGRKRKKQKQRFFHIFITNALVYMMPPEYSGGFRNHWKLIIRSENTILLRFHADNKPWPFFF